MAFCSSIFLFMFLPITIIIYYLLSKEYRNYWLLVASLFFYGWGQPKYITLLLFNVLINYISALLIKYSRWKKTILTLCLSINLGLLIYFKYFNFLIESINNIWSTSYTMKDIVLPIGISFFTFQGISYVIDVYRQDVLPQKNPFKLALYISLFPQLVAGPIVRYKDVMEEIDNRTNSIEDFAQGSEQFIIGLGKKALIANSMAMVVDSIWSKTPGTHLSSVAWLGSVAYALQIYYDFSGYSDMAIGLGRIFGFHFKQNFNLPYTAASISEFWRKWHISLSSWFRDYVYIPLGGNRKRVYLNLAIVFLLTGIWHGAAWTFVLWGIWNGFFILVERFLVSHMHNGSAKPATKISCGIGVFYTLFVVNLGWVLFRAETISDAFLYMGNMFGGGPDVSGFTWEYYCDNWTRVMLLCGVFFATSIPCKLANILKKYFNPQVFLCVKYVILLGVFYLGIIRVVAGTYNPFIYFQF